MAEGKDLKLNTKVAIKYPRPDKDLDNTIPLFEREARVLTSLSSFIWPKNFGEVVKFREGFKLAGIPFLILDYLPRKGIKDWSGNCPYRQLFKIGMALCGILKVLHHRFSLVYRDLKPSNIKRNPNKFTLIDFNTAVKKDELSQNQRVRFLGTPGWSPPECTGELTWKLQSPATDVYMLGRLLYFLLVGEVPKNPGTCDPGRSSVKFPHHLREAIRKATQFRPQDRYQWIEHFEDQLLGIEHPKKAKIIYKSKEIPIRSGSILGRKNGYSPPDFVIRDPKKKISKAHARILNRGGSWYMEDLFSHGSWIRKNGKWRKIDPGGYLQLADGDKVALGSPDHFRFTFRSGSNGRRKFLINWRLRR